VCLRKSPVRSPAFLAAHRRNAQKCTGPRTPAGKAHSSLNPAGRDGRFAHRLPQNLRAAGAGGVAGLFERFRQQISPTYRPESAVGVARHNWMRNKTGTFFRITTVRLEVRSLFPIWAGGESCAEKKMLKMRFKATMLLKTNKNAFGTKPFFRFKAKSCEDLATGMLLKTNKSAFGTKPFFRFKAKYCRFSVGDFRLPICDWMGAWRGNGNAFACYTQRGVQDAYGRE